MTTGLWLLQITTDVFRLFGCFNSKILEALGQKSVNEGMTMEL